MSHLFGRVRYNPQSKFNPPDASYGRSLADTGTFQLSLKGIPDTSFYQLKEKSTAGFAVVGVGLKEEACIIKHMAQKDWETFYKNASPGSEIQGHYLFIKWDKQNIYIQNDILGLRTIYLYNDDHGNITFSTRLDWLARSLPGPELDIKHFSSFWLLINQMRWGSFLKKVRRLGPNGKISIVNGKISIEEKPYQPNHKTCGIDDFHQHLKYISNPVSTHKVSLGLSGGLDSRTLLACLSSDNLFSHTYFIEDHPDPVIAGNLANQVKSHHVSYKEDVPDFNNEEKEIIDYVAQLNGTSLAYGYSKSKTLKALNHDNKLLIDGGFGEIYRRQYLGKLAFMNFKSPKEIKITNLYNALSDHKIDMFNPDLKQEMQEIALSQLECAWEMVIKEFHGGSLGDCLDLFSLWNRVTNIAGMDHGWYDSLIPAYMPFIQKRLLDTGLGIPERFRRNGYLFRKIIKQSNLMLDRYPLVKGIYSYPYYLQKYPSHLYITLKKHFVSQPRNDFGKRFLYKNKDYVLDLMGSKGVQECDLYNYPNIQSIVSDFYNGQDHFELYVNQWLTFELWRKANQLG